MFFIHYDCIGQFVFFIYKIFVVMFHDIIIVYMLWQYDKLYFIVIFCDCITGNVIPYHYSFQSDFFVQEMGTLQPPWALTMDCTSASTEPCRSPSSTGLSYRHEWLAWSKVSCPCHRRVYVRSSVSGHEEGQGNALLDKEWEVSDFVHIRSWPDEASDCHTY